MSADDMSCSNCSQSKPRQVIIHGAAALSKVALGIGTLAATDTKQRRMICGNCEYSTSKGISMFTLCKKCKCLLMAKTQLANEHCPILKW